MRESPALARFIAGFFAAGPPEAAVLGAGAVTGGDRR
jgi:hypothetical protein